MVGEKVIQRKPLVKFLAQWCCLFILAGAIFFIKSNILTVATVCGNSMYPSMQDGDLLIVARNYYTLSLEDVILIQVPSAKLGEKYIVKRIIATGGDTVSIDYDKNEVRINDKVLYEPYVNLQQPDPMLPIDGNHQIEYQVPEGQVFVLGDNRNFSLDSRQALLGFVDASNIVGTVIAGVQNP